MKKKEEKKGEENVEKGFDETKDLLSLEQIKEKINDPIIYESMLWYLGLHGTYDNHSRRCTPCMTLVDFKQQVEKYKDKKLSFRDLEKADGRIYACAAYWSSMGMRFKSEEEPDTLFMPLIEFKRKFEAFLKKK